MQRCSLSSVVRLGRAYLFVVLALFAAFGAVLAPTVANAACAVTYTFSNGTTADATQVNQNFADIAACSDGSSFWTQISGTSIAPISTSFAVGIGTTSVPTARLQVIGPTGANQALIGDGNNAVGLGVDSNAAYINSVFNSKPLVIAANNNNNITAFHSGGVFFGKLPWTDPGPDKFVFSGKVGIGTTAPGYTLDVAGDARIGTTGTPTHLELNGSLNVTGAVTCGSGCGGSNYWSLTGSNLVPTSTSYKIGLGSVTSPAYTLDVGGTLNVTGALTCGSGCSAGPWSVSSGAIIPSSTSYSVGIGTTTPLAMLDVYGAGTSGIRVLSGGSSSSTSLIVGRTASEGYFAIVGTANQWVLGSAAGDMVLTIPGSGKLMLSSQAPTATPNLTLSGTNVGIGTVSPSHTLEVNGSLNVTGAVTCGSGCSSGPWSVSGSSIIPSSTSYKVGIGTTSPTHTLEVDGSLHVSGAVTCGSGCSGAEGAFTPVLSFGGSTTGITYSMALNGRYFKIGKMVTIWITGQLSNKGSASGYAAVAGLPFTSRNTSGYITDWTFMAANIATGIVPGGQLSQNSTTLSLVKMTPSAGTGTLMSESDFTNSTYISMSFQYLSEA